MGSLLMSESRRSGTWHFGHTVSIPNTLRNKSDHLMYLDLRLGLSWPGSGGPASWGLGTTSLRKAACEESTPQYRTVCFRGDGTRAARRAIRASGGSWTDEVPLETTEQYT